MNTSREIGIGRTQVRHCRSANDEDVGLCISCGNRITLCGIGFTADIECCKCRSINRFVNSKQPVSIVTRNLSVSSDAT